MSGDVRSLEEVIAAAFDKNTLFNDSTHVVRAGSRAVDLAGIAARGVRAWCLAPERIETASAELSGAFTRMTAEFLTPKSAELLARAALHAVMGDTP